MRHNNSIIAAITLLIFLSYRANAQWISQIQTESDWETLLNQGYFDYNSYQLYRDLTEGEAVNDTAVFIQSVLGNTPSDLISPLNGKALIHSDARTKSNHFSIRAGQKIREGQNSGYLSFFSSSPNFEVDLKGRNENNSWKTERRYVSIVKNNARIIIGNFTTNIGSGLGIGRFDYRPLLSSQEIIGKNFIFPDNSYYNGAKIELNNKLTAIYSSKKYMSVNKYFYGGALSFPTEKFRVGLTLGATELKSNMASKTLGEGSVFFNKPSYGLSTEFGYAESGIGFIANIEKENSDFNLWHYDRSFINLQSSGMAYPDYISFRDEWFPISFRQAQTGESGMSIRCTKTLNTFNLFGWATVWKKNPSDPVSLDNSFGLRYKVVDYFDINARYSEKFGRISGRTISEFGLNYLNKFQLSGLVSLWVDGKGTDFTNSFAYLFASIPVNNRVFASARIRSHFNGELEYFIEEKTIINEQFSLNATYRWNKSYGRDNGPLYIVMETDY